MRMGCLRTKGNARKKSLQVHFHSLRNSIDARKGDKLPPNEKKNGRFVSQQELFIGVSLVNLLTMRRRDKNQSFLPRRPFTSHDRSNRNTATSRIIRYFTLIIVVVQR